MMRVSRECVKSRVIHHTHPNLSQETYYRGLTMYFPSPMIKVIHDLHSFFFHSFFRFSIGIIHLMKDVSPFFHLMKDFSKFFILIHQLSIHLNFSNAPLSFDLWIKIIVILFINCLMQYRYNYSFSKIISMAYLGSSTSFC